MRGGSGIWAVAAMVVAGIAGIVILAAVGDREAANLLPLLIGFLAPTITGVLAAQKAGENQVALKSIDGRLNGELDARIEAAVASALGKYHAATSDDCAGDGCGKGA